jgi:hypothetical protein
MATFGGSNIVTDGLVLWLDAANRKSYPGSGNTWLDLSGNGYNGTLTNGPTFNSANNGSIVFDGTNDYISTSGISTSFTEFAIETWIYVSQPQPNEYSSIVFSRGGGGIITGLHFLGNAFGGNGYKLSYTYNGSGYTWTGPPSISQVGWTSVSLVFVGSSAIFYINGIYAAANFQALSTTNLSVLNIGRDSSVFSRYFKGSIGTVKIYNRALSAQEVQQNYDALKSRYLNIY